MIFRELFKIELFQRYVSEKQYPGDHYPTYCSETGYLMTSDMAPMIFEKSLDIPPSIPFDDIYLGIVVNALNILPVKILIFNIKFFFSSFKCNFKRSTSGFNYGKFVVQRACEYRANAFTIVVGGKNFESRTKIFEQLHAKLQSCD